MRTIVKIAFGSHLYGTATPTSDRDYKSVFVPSARDILLQRVKGSVSTKRPKGEHEKNYAGEVDEEAYSLQRYLGLVAEGQTVALDVLFAPASSFIGLPEREWVQIQQHRDRLVSRRSAAFVDHCRQQANKYGIKGSRVAAARAALELVQTYANQYGDKSQLSLINFDKLAPSEHLKLLDIEGPLDVTGKPRVVRHWEVCNRKLPLTVTLKYAHEVLKRIVDEYGARALQAERNEGIDWKALSHAVRIGRQAVELFTTHHVTFPRPEAEHLVKIKLGELPYEPVAEEIEDLLERVEVEAARSTLPERPDLAWVDDFVADVHRRAIVS